MKKPSHLFLAAFCVLVSSNAWAQDNTTPADKPAQADTSGHALADAYDAVVASLNNGESDALILEKANNFINKADEQFAKIQPTLSKDEQDSIQNELNNFKNLIATAQLNGSFNRDSLQKISIFLRDFKRNATALWPIERRAQTLNPNAAHPAQALLNNVNTNSTPAIASPTTG